ncbi:MAG TPA: VOC family protein, partial [Sphingomicrobium sp.]|nr:VOC family protein [Sphingomicrobium sp.]
MSHFRAALLTLVLIGCTSREPGAPARIDHVIVGVSDLERGVREIERLTGVRAVTGGAHPGQGTRNALLSLGEDSYLEIYAPNPVEPVSSPAVEELRALDRPTPIGWAASTSDSRSLRSTLESKGFPLSQPERGSRRRPDGSSLSWVTYGFAKLDHPLAPFFIEWGDARLHPSRTSPEGCSLRSLRIEDPAADRLRRA